MSVSSSPALYNCHPVNTSYMQKHIQFRKNIYKLCAMSRYIPLLMELQDMCDRRYDRNTRNCKSNDKVGKPWATAIYG
jgi:hypothetical protein